jgi:3D (Asp-Asp-Asp) domain-containing protein
MAKITQKIIRKSLYLFDKLLPIFMLFVAINWSMPHLALAAGLDLPGAFDGKFNLENGNKETLTAAKPAIPHLPLNEALTIKKPRLTVQARVTAYNSDPNQTDNTPCITASGLNVCERAKNGREDIVATNIKNLPFGTRIRIPELYGDKLFIVADRMNPRYAKSVDIWMSDYDQAMDFGKQWATVEIF